VFPLHFAGSLILLCGLSACSAPAPSEADVTSVLESFYGAMGKGDTAGAMNLIAPDAVFVEGGRLETRAEYEKNHLPLDIEFESQVKGVRSPMKVTFQGDDTAWIIATTDFDGTFNGAPISLTSAQLAVLTRNDASQWLIRSIHWSSRRR
jgi:ketosteroid isomerase-like protein